MGSKPRPLPLASGLSGSHVSAVVMSRSLARSRRARGGLCSVASAVLWREALIQALVLTLTLATCVLHGVAAAASAKKDCTLGEVQLNHTISAIRAAKITRVPYPHVFIEKIFEPSLYECIVKKKLPATEQAYTRKNEGKSNAVKSRLRRYIVNLSTVAPKGKFGSDDVSKTAAKSDDYDAEWWTKFAKLFGTSSELRSAWLDLFQSTLRNRDKAWRTKFRYYTRLDLTRDYGGYAIGPHADNSDKWVTMLYYLPRESSKLKVGTCVLKNLLKRRVPSQSDVSDWSNTKSWETSFQAPFKRNVVFAFAPCFASWHAVPMTPEGFRRDTIQSFIQTVRGNAPKGKCGGRAAARA